MKKEARNEVETAEKIWGYVAGEGEVEHRGKEPRGPLKRALLPKKFGRKKYRKMCVENRT